MKVSTCKTTIFKRPSNDGIIGGGCSDKIEAGSGDDVKPGI